MQNDSFHAQLDVPGSVAAPFCYSQQQPRPCTHIHSQGMESSAQKRTYASMTVTTLGGYPTPPPFLHLASVSEKVCLQTLLLNIGPLLNIGTAVS